MEAESWPNPNLGSRVGAYCPNLGSIVGAYCPISNPPISAVGTENSILWWQWQERVGVSI